MRARSFCFELLGTAVIGFTVVATPALGHHAFAGQYDPELRVSFEGVVTKIQWQNPHVWIYVDATDKDGKTTHWEAETTNPNTLLRSGWKPNDLKAGDHVTIEGPRAICCENVMNAQSIILPNGSHWRFQPAGAAQEKPSQ